MTPRYRPAELTDRTAALFTAAGLDDRIARCVADILVEAELLGYDTHGLQFIPAYIRAIETGATATSGEPRVLADHGNTILLDANRLPGQWAVIHALEMALVRLPAQRVVTVAIRRCGNISCLATYVKRAAGRGAMAILATSSPDNNAVAPPGARQGRLSTDPLAVGIPAEPHPILIDTSTASVSNRRIERARRAGTRLPFPALIDAQGRPTDDPEAFFADPPGAIMPVGGAELGHKGFAFAILVEALTSGLAGIGRASDGKSGGSNIFLQVIDAAGFAGAEAFRRETSALAAHCRAAEPADPAAPVRMPGDRAFRLFAEQSRAGVALHPEVAALIRPVFERYGVAIPEVIA